MSGLISRHGINCHWLLMLSMIIVQTSLLLAEMQSQVYWVCRYLNANDGVVDNKGIEIALNWDDKISNFTYHWWAVFICTQ